MDTINIERQHNQGELMIPFSLQKQIVEFLTSLPNINTSNALQAFLYSAGLDQELHQQIDNTIPPGQFFQLFVPILSKYGKLNDGRDALQSILEAAKSYVGQERRMYCDLLIQEVDKLLSPQHTNQPSVISSKRLKNRPITYLLRPQVRHFVNRKKMREQLRSELNDEQKIFIVVDGLAGIGKTSLAAKVAEEVEDKFAGIYYTRCSQDTDLAQILAELSYFLSEHGDNTFEGIFEYNIPHENKINFLLSSLSRQQYLLIFDDVHKLLDEQCHIKAPALQMLFDGLLTQTHQSKVLIVSRIRPFFHRYLVVQSKNTLGNIDSQGGREFFQILGVDEDEQLLEQAYQLTAGHPLAMELLVGLTEVMSLEDILADKHLFYDNTNVVEQLLQQLYNNLKPEEQKLLRKIAILPRPANRDLICYLGEHKDTPEHLNSLLNKLLISYDKKLKIYRLHDLIYAFNHSKMSNAEKEAYHLRAATYYEDLEYDRGKPTIEQVQLRLEAHYHYYNAHYYEKAAAVLVEVSIYLRKWGYLERSRILLRETLNALESLSPNNERQLLMIDLLVELGWLERYCEGLVEALKYCRRAENLLEGIDDQKRKGKLYYALGEFLYRTVNWKEAETYLTHAFEIKKQQKDSSALPQIISDFRTFYISSGRLEAIEVKCREGIEICRSQGDTESALQILVNILGSTLREQHRFDEALAIYEEGLSLKSSNDFIGRSLSLSLIGHIYLEKELYEDALKNYEESLKFAKQTADYIAQAYALQGIGDTYKRRGRIRDTIPIYEEAITIAEKSLDLLGLASFLEKIADSYEKVNVLEKMMEQLEKSLQLYEKLGSLSGLANVSHHIGNVYLHRYSDLANSLKYFKISLDSFNKLYHTLGSDQEKRAIISVYIEQGKTDEAIELLQLLFKSTEGREGPHKLVELRLLGAIYSIKQEYQRASDFLEYGLELYKKEDSRRPDIKSGLLNQLGEIYIALGKYEKALAIFEESSQLKKESFRRTPQLTNIAEVYYHQEKLFEAFSKCEESLFLSRQHGSPIQSGKTLHLMANIHLKNSQYSQALNCIIEAVNIFKKSGSRYLPESEKILQQIQETLKNDQEMKKGR